MQNVQIFIQEYRNGTERIRQAEERKELKVILRWLFYGILTGLAWKPAWTWFLTGELVIENPWTIIPALFISATGAVILLPTVWSRLQQAPGIIRWALAYSYGWGSITFLREGPIEAGLNALNMHAASFAFSMADSTLGQRALFIVAIALGVWLGRRFDLFAPLDRLR